MTKFFAYIFALTWVSSHAFLPSDSYLRPVKTAAFSRAKVVSSVSQKPLYDGTNYTFPDTTTVDGIAEVLEVSFVHSCMQLAGGYVDILKMFIATAMASYEFGFSIADVQKALEDCPNQTANRPLMKEELDLREKWLCLVYLTLMDIGHPSRRNISVETVPGDLREDYGGVVSKVAGAHKIGDGFSMEQILADESASLPAVEKALRSQSIRVIQLTPTVILEALEARPDGASPPKPPIEGAFE
jgi:hypothetical protein